MILYYAGIAFTVATAVLCVRRGQASPWLWIILLFPTVGAAVYLLSEVVSRPGSGGEAGRTSKREMQHAEVEVRRLDNSAAWTHYAQTLRGRKRYAEARAAAESAVAKDPSSPHARYELGLAQMGEERFEQAVSSLEPLVEASPQFDGGEAAFALAVSLQRSGKSDDARSLLETLARTTSLPKVLFSLASLQAEAGLEAKARETLQRIIHEAEYVPSYHRREVKPWVKKARKALAAL